MEILATEQKSYNCQEDSDCSVADSLINIGSLIVNRQEEAMSLVWKKGCISPNKGKKASEITKQKLSISHKNPYPKIPILCACGCGVTVWKSVNKFIKGHFNKTAKEPKTCKVRIPWNKGKQWSEDMKKKFSENHADFTKEKHPRWNGGAKAVKRRCDLKRQRQLGYIPLNSPFAGAAGHHVNRELVIYIHRGIHTKIWHSLDRPETMERINKIAFDFLLRGI